LDTPAILSPVWRGDKLVYPMNNALAPYATPLLIYGQPWLGQAVYVSFRKFNELSVGSSRHIYSYEEAVIGIPQEKFRSLPRGTSAGYPYVLKYKDGKTEFFGKGEKYDLKTPASLELEARVEHIIDSAKKGIRLSHVFQDFLKDERRSPAKIEAVATRLISAAPVDYVVAVRRYFGAITTSIMSHTIATGMAPGVCAYSQWADLANHLSRKGVDVFDGDFKHFDTSEQPTILRLILKHINAWYNDGPENARVREVLWLDLMHSRHIGGIGNDQRHIYQWNKSLPSGHPLTTIVNSLYCLVMLVGAYISCTGDMCGFWDFVAPITYGDDNAANVAPEIVEVYNQVTVSAALKKEFGMTYTPGRKDGVWNPTMRLEDITFLKRSFAFDAGGKCLCPLELGSFLYTVYWNKDKRREQQYAIDVLEVALMEMSMHTEEVWDKYIGTIMEMFAELLHIPLYEPTLASYRRMTLSRTEDYY